MFPTPVGMNRWLDFPVDDCLHVPHARGDEPADKSRLRIPLKMTGDSEGR